MDAAPREIQWLKRIMKELGDDQEGTMPAKQKAAERSAARPSTTCNQDEDDSEVDRLMRRAVLLLRVKATNALRDIVLFGEDAVESTDGEDKDEELDELLQRAALLLRQRLAKQSRRGGEAAALNPGVTSQQEEGDEELDRLLRRAMLLFGERRKLSTGAHNAEIDAELDVVRHKMIKVAKGSASPGSPGITDGEDFEEEDDDELDQLLRREMAQLRQQSSSPAGNQQSTAVDESLDDVEHDVRPMGWRKALRLQHMTRMQQEERQKRPRREREILTERKRKRARGLIELQKDDDDDDVEHPAEEESDASCSPATIIEGPIATDTTESDPVEITIKTEPPHSHNQRLPEAKQVEQKRQELRCVTPVRAVSERLQTVEAAQQTHAADDDALLTLRASNAKLMQENASLKQQLQLQKADTRMVLLLQEQVQRLQQRELELMRALAQCSDPATCSHLAMDVAAPVAVRIDTAVPARSPQKLQKKHKHHKHKKDSNGPQTPRGNKPKRRRNNL
ncbi:hypothetical protein PC118_g23992, partial [Phytophthora cactorum]